MIQTSLQIDGSIKKKSKPGLSGVESSAYLPLSFLCFLPVQTQVSDVEKEGLRQQLSGKILLLSELREEAMGLENQLERQRQEMALREKELEDLHGFLESLDPQDPRYVSRLVCFI